jgi:Cu(I)/Ag(I) efflux system membrane protein CusA/SilA
MGGMQVGETIEGRERYGILVRYAREYRDSIEALERVFVPTPGGAQIPITQVADIEFRTVPPSLRNEDGELVSFVFVDVGGAIGIADYVDAARRVVAERVDLPAGYRLEWAGQFTYFERAKARLAVLVPPQSEMIGAEGRVRHERHDGHGLGTPRRVQRTSASTALTSRKRRRFGTTQL